MEQAETPAKPALPLLLLLVFASALGVVVAIALAGITMLLAAPAYAGDGSLLLEGRAGMAEARLLFSESESHEDGLGVRTRVLEEFHNPFAERLAGIYLHRLPENAVLERLSFTLPSEEEDVEPVAASHALFTPRRGALVERTAQIGPGDTLLVELEYRIRSPRRVLAAK